MTPSPAAKSGEPVIPDDELSPERTQRADARKNRERVLVAAEEVFAARGVHASTEEVARRAGVGIGTVYRHFPTKEALLEAVMLRRLRRFADRAGALTSDTDLDPGEAFFRLLALAVDQSAAKNAVAEVLSDAGIELTTIAAPVMAEVRAALASLLQRAQAAGAVRADIGVDEVTALLIGAARAANSGGLDGEIVRRMVEIISDGLRPSNPQT